MKCPLLLIGCYITEKEISARHEECREEECAWWDKGGLRCGLMSLVERLGWVKKALTDIAKELTLVRGK